MRTLDFSDGFGSGSAPTVTPVPASDVSNTPSGNLSASTVQAALNELQSDIDTLNLATALPSGMVLPYAGTSAPAGYLFCYGQAVSRTTYSALFTALGTTYGTGDGSTTFNLPDLRGRVAVGRDDMGGGAAVGRITAAASGITGTTLGAAGGSETHTLSTNQLPSHTHTQNSHTHSGNGLGSGEFLYNRGSGGTYAALGGGTAVDRTTSPVAAATATNQNTGNGEAHNNVQPSIILNYIIKT
jgi:microcystin-dependent protein